MQVKNPKTGVELTSAFHDPYYIYDCVTFYDRVLNQWTTRRRCTAVSFTNNGEILVTMAICNPIDRFTRKKARETALSRIEKFIVDTNDGAEVQSSISTIEKHTSFYQSLDCYVEYVESATQHMELFCLPLQMEYTAVSKINNKFTRRQLKDCTSQIDLANAFFHADFIGFIHDSFLASVSTDIAQ